MALPFHRGTVNRCALVAHRAQDVFGAVRGLTGSQPNDFTFAGEQVDGSTALQYLRARYYDPEVGRFISRDPIGGMTTIPSTENRFTYGMNRPSVLTDPSGNGPCVVLIVGGPPGVAIAVSWDVGVDKRTGELVLVGKGKYKGVNVRTEEKEEDLPTYEDDRED